MWLPPPKEEEPPMEVSPPGEGGEGQQENEQQEEASPPLDPVHVAGHDPPQPPAPPPSSTQGARPDDSTHPSRVMRTILLRMAQALQCTGFAADRAYDLDTDYRSLTRYLPEEKDDTTTPPISATIITRESDQAYAALLSEFRLFKQLALASVDDIETTTASPSRPFSPSPSGQEKEDAGAALSDDDQTPSTMAIKKKQKNHINGDDTDLLASVLCGSRSAVINFVTEIENLIKTTSGESRLAEEIKACDSPGSIPRLPDGCMAPKMTLIALRSADQVMQLAASARLHGFLPHLVRNGAQALSRYSDMPYQLVILDAFFPMLTGLEVTRCIRKYENRLEFYTRSKAARGSFIIIVRNGYPIDKFKEKAVSAGADYCVETVEEISFPNVDAILEGFDGVAMMESGDDEAMSVACSTLSTLSSAAASVKAGEEGEGLGQKKQDQQQEEGAPPQVEKQPVKCESPPSKPGKSPPQHKRPRAALEVEVASEPLLSARAQPQQGASFNSQDRDGATMGKLEDEKELPPSEDTNETRGGDEDEDLEMKTWAETPKKGASAAAPAAASAAVLDNGQEIPKIRRACAYCHSKKDYEPKHRINKKRRVDRLRAVDGAEEHDGRAKQAGGAGGANGGGGYVGGSMGNHPQYDGMVSSSSLNNSLSSSYGPNGSVGGALPYASIMLPSTSAIAPSPMHLYTTPIVTTGNLTLEQPSNTVLRLPSYNYAPPPNMPTGPMTASAFLDPRVATSGPVPARLMPMGMSSNFPSTWWPGSADAGSTPLPLAPSMPSNPTEGAPAPSASFGSSSSGTNGKCLLQRADIPNGVCRDFSGTILKRYLVEPRADPYTNFKVESPSRPDRRGVGGARTESGDSNTGSTLANGETQPSGFNVNNFFLEEGE